MSHINPLMNFSKISLKIPGNSCKPKQVTFSWIWMYLHILHKVHVTMSVLLVFIGICIASSFNRNFKLLLCLYVVQGKIRISKTILIECCPENVFDSTILLSIILLFLFVLYCWSCVSGTKYFLVCREVYCR